MLSGKKLSLFLSNDLEESKKNIKITRVHLEEDTGKLIHSTDKESTLLDFNRAGVPLMELVTEPVIHTGKEARLFAQGFQLLLRTLGVSGADMERGQMRCEVNISLTKDERLGIKVEIKNLNSFRAVEKSVDFEIQRQKEILEKGEKVIQETRGWDSGKEITYSQRLKEEAQDYRYFPEPDLPRLHIYSEKGSDGLFNLEEIKKQILELPWQKKERIIKDMTIHVQAQKLVLTASPVTIITRANLLIQDERLMSFFEKVVGEFNNIAQENKEKAVSLAFNYLTSDLKGIMESESITWEKLKITPQNFSQLIVFLSEDKISSRAGKDILIEMIKQGGKPEEIIKSKGLEKISDEGQLESIISEIIKNNPKVIEDYKKGKENALQFLVGQAMAKTHGAADPKILEKLFKEQLKTVNK